MSFGEFLGGMIVFFFWVMYIWMFIAVFGDIFRRDDLGGWHKAGWIFLIFVIPLLGILLYLVTRPKPTAEEQAMMQAAMQQSAPAAPAPAYSAAGEIEKAKKLLDSGAITAEEFDVMKKKAMAAA
jgi:hypothetical protein